MALDSFKFDLLLTNSGSRNVLSRVVSGIDEADAIRRYDLEEADNKYSLPDSYSSSISPAERKVISWQDGDPENPYNWSKVSGFQT